MNKTLEDIKKKLQELKPIIKEKYQVKKIGIFGSFSRGEQKPASDLDLLVEFFKPISLFDFLRLESFLSRQLNIKVDLVVKDNLKARIRNQILQTTIYA